MTSHLLQLAEKHIDRLIGERIEAEVTAEGLQTELKSVQAGYEAQIAVAHKDIARLGKERDAARSAVERMGLQIAEQKAALCQSLAERDDARRLLAESAAELEALRTAIESYRVDARSYSARFDRVRELCEAWDAFEAFGRDPSVVAWQAPRRTAEESRLLNLVLAARNRLRADAGEPVSEPPPAPAVRDAGETDMCGFDQAWVGPCKLHVPCAKHDAQRCWCGAKARQSCDYDGDMAVCGYPTCEQHECIMIGASGRLHANDGGGYRQWQAYHAAKQPTQPAPSEAAQPGPAVHADALLNRVAALVREWRERHHSAFVLAEATLRDIERVLAERPSAKPAPVAAVAAEPVCGAVLSDGSVCGRLRSSSYHDRSYDRVVRVHAFEPADSAKPADGGSDGE